MRSEPRLTKSRLLWDRLTPTGPSWSRPPDKRPKKSKSTRSVSPRQSRLHRTDSMADLTIEPTPIQNQIHPSSRRSTPPKARFKHVAPRFGSARWIPVSNQANYQQQGPRYQAPAFRKQPQQPLPPQQNSFSIEDLQNITATIHDLKMQVGQLADTLAGFETNPSQTIPNPKGGGVGMARLRSGKELPQPVEHQPSPQSAEAGIESGPNSQMQQLPKSVPLPFPNRAVMAKRFEIDEDLLKLFRKIKINIPLFDTIK
ncbi:hypothetical protein CR513_36779, partial [Mucuna pruriens]